MRVEAVDGARRAPACAKARCPPLDNIEITSLAKFEGVVAKLHKSARHSAGRAAAMRSTFWIRPAR
ncbi:hypothetical protein [Piscinibacter sp.]|uniref:hypothetical protein n=1 Tax=Piscinibacter sp. TaxID=1903157 RepID=UPI0025D4A1D2|nr:hypothetical protein [Piscinibacter sp.]